MRSHSDVLERTDLKPTDTGDHDRFAHYYSKRDLEQATFDGVEITALCGKKDVPTRDFTKYPTCRTCQEVLDGIPE